MQNKACVYLQNLQLYPQQHEETLKNLQFMNTTLLPPSAAARLAPAAKEIKVTPDVLATAILLDSLERMAASEVTKPTNRPA